MTALNDVPSFIFGGENTSIRTPEDLARKRALVDAMMNQEIGSQTPRNIGEGLGAIGKALMIRKARGDLADNIGQVQSGQDALWSSPTARQALGMSPIVDAAMAQQSAPNAPLEPITEMPLGPSGNIQTSQINGNLPPALTSGQPVSQTPAPMPQGAASGQLQALLSVANDPAFAFASPAKQQIVLEQIKTIQGQNTPMAQLQMQNMQLEYNQRLHPDQIPLPQLQQIQLQNAQNQLSAPTPDIQEYKYAKTNGYTGSFADWQASKKGTGGANGVYGTVYWDAGQPFAMNKDGSAMKRIPIEGGGQLIDPATMTGNKATANAQGKSKGEASAAYSSLSSKLPGLEKVVGELDALAERATFTQAGQAYNYGRTQLGMEPTDGALARTEYMAKVDNQVLPMLRDTFGAAFTEREGTSLKAILGDPNKTPAEKKVALKTFIEQKRRDVEAVGVQGGVINAAPIPITGKTSSGVGWSVQ